MATHPVGEANQQLWDEMLTRLLNLSTATVRRNADLENRVAELENELSAWKQAHSDAIESSERDIQAHNVQIASLNRQISNMDAYKTHHNPLILCVVNGDEYIFNQGLLMQGYEGGKSGAQHLTKAIAEHLTKAGIQTYGRLSFWITVYFNKMELVESLVANCICNRDQFEAFLAGFSQASPRFCMVDVGCYKPDAVESKIKETLQTFSRFPQTLHIFLGGYSPAFSSTFHALGEEQLLGKLVMISTAPDANFESLFPPLPHLKLDGLFIKERLPPIKKLSPLNVGSYSAATSNGGLISPQSPARGVGRVIDPSLPLHKQNPPPCNEHYLMTCSKGAIGCKYSHDYILTEDQLISLANNAKKAPCNFLKNGLQCPFGDKCCWGHTCPNGPKCFHLSKGKCWFKGEAMHPPLSTDSPN